MQRFYEHFEKKELTVRIFDLTGTDPNGRKVYAIRVWKYNIFERYLKKVANDAKRKFPAAEYMDVYDKNSRLFQKRVYL